MEVLGFTLKEETRTQYSRAATSFLAYLYENPELSEALTEEFRMGCREAHSVHAYAQQFFAEARSAPPPFPLSDAFRVGYFEEFVAAMKTRKATNPSASALRTYRSGFTYLNKICNRAVPHEWDQSLKNFYSGIKKREAKDKADGTMQLTEGKEAMPFELYRFICKDALQNEPHGKAMFHLCVTLCWNLCCRAGNLVNIRYEHMCVRDDALAIYFAQTKMDQEGSKSKDPRHVYANPEMPEICPVLSLGIFFLVNGTQEHEASFHPIESHPFVRVSY
jgi:hypothetical protein